MIILSKITSSKISDLIWAMSTYLYWLECVCEVLWPQTHFLPPVRAIFDSAFWHWTITLKGGCPSCVTLDLQAVLCELEIWLHAVLYGLLCTQWLQSFCLPYHPGDPGIAKAGRYLFPSSAIISASHLGALCLRNCKLLCNVCLLLQLAKN